MEGSSNSNVDNSKSNILNVMKESLLKDKKMSRLQGLLQHWKGRKDFAKAQAQMVGVLLVAYIGNNWPISYHRNENHNPTMFWLMNAAVAAAAFMTLKHDPNESARGVQLLSRAQTEEWKGWMQWAFVMYHYYRMYSVYNEIRVFVSAYVWMTGFGNFLYFDKKGDFTMERAVSMWLRINYFPLLLSTFLRVPLELYYVVPLHTVGFFVTMATCYLAKVLEQAPQVKQYIVNRWQANVAAIGVCVLVHIIFYETPMCNFLKLFSDEYYFRFTSDRYSALIGIISGLFWGKFRAYMHWAYNPTNSNAATAKSDSEISQVENGEDTSTSTSSPTNSSSSAFAETAQRKEYAMYIQRLAGIGLMLGWYAAFGRITDKYTYNPIHPYVFWMPVAGWLMVRNSSKYLCELHAGALEFLGKITLETYVLQFHIFMCKDVQHIPVIVPGGGQNGYIILKTLNMLVWGSLFLFLSYHARQITVTTQTTVTDLVTLLRYGPPSSNKDGSNEDEEKQEMLPLDRSDNVNVGFEKKTSEIVTPDDNEGSSKDGLMKATLD